MLERSERSALHQAEARAVDITHKVLSGVVEVRINNAALEDSDGDIVLRGTIDFRSLIALKTDWYQREVLSAVRKAGSLANAVAGGLFIPDVALSMRGQRFHSKGNSVILEDPVYIVDGLQRISAMKAYIDAHPESDPLRPLGCAVYFGKTAEWEAERFEAWNAGRVPVSPNVHLRNQRNGSPAILTIYGLSKNDKDCVLYEKVSWDQRMKRGEIMSALTVCKSAAVLHSALTFIGGGGGGISKRASSIMGNAAKRAGGLNQFRANVKEFYDIVDEVWGIQNIEYSKLAPHIKSTFLCTLAGMFAQHDNFWRGNKLFVDAPTKKKLRSFPIHDPSVARLAAAGGMAAKLLLDLMIEHMNKGKKMNRLIARKKLNAPTKTD